MDLARKVRNILRGLLQVYGTKKAKRCPWNIEFSRRRWDCLERTSGDCIYPSVEKYARNGSILDLGCGSGSIGNELDATTHRHYTGVDISDVAIEKARRRAEASRRANKSRYFVSDVLDYVPTQQCDVIPFRDAMYYVARGNIKAMLDRYSMYLKKGSVFIIRISDGSDQYKRIVDAIETNFGVVEKMCSTNRRQSLLFFSSGSGSSARGCCVLALPMIATWSASYRGPSQLPS